MESEPTTSIQGERLDLLYQLSQTFNSTLDLDEVLNRVMDEVIRVMKAERGFLMLVEDGGDLEFRTARGLDQSTIQDPEFQISRGIVERTALEGVPLLTSDASHDERFSDRQSVVSLKLRSILCVPLQNKDQIAGVIYVDNRLLAGIFTQEDLDFLAAIASNAAIAIENARLYQIAVEKGRMERELRMAHQVQESLLPNELPNISGWDFAARWIPAREVAGDYYDFVKDDQGVLHLVVGDVTDKGLPASLFMVFTRSAVRASLESQEPLNDVMQRANRLLCLESGEGLFVTLFLGTLDPKTGNLVYVNAGHNPALVFRRETAEFENLIRTGIPVGIDPDSVYELNTVNLSPGDSLIIYTDGIPEAVNADAEQYGMERFMEAIVSSGAASAETLTAGILDSLAAFTGNRPSFDDITLLTVYRKHN